MSRSGLCCPRATLSKSNNFEGQIRPQSTKGIFAWVVKLFKRIWILKVNQNIFELHESYLKDILNSKYYVFKLQVQ